MTDWKSLFDDLGVPNWDSGKNVAAGCISIQCPFCDDPSNHCNFSIEKATLTCWRCDGGHPVKAVSLAAHIPMNTARELINKHSVGGAPYRSYKAVKPTAAVQHITVPGKPLQQCHRNYLTGRGFDPDLLIARHGIVGTDLVGSWQGIDFRYRIIIPVYDVSGKLCTFQGRDYTGQQELRYKCCPVDMAVTHHKHLLYGAELSRNRDRIVVVEGVFDQWRMGPGSVATFGTSLTREQLNMLSRWPEVVFLFDPEPEAQQRARNYAVDLAACGCRVEVCSAELGYDKNGSPRDPGDLTEHEALPLRKELGLL